MKFFTRNRAKRSGYNPSCRDCHAVYQHQHYMAHRQKYIARAGARTKRAVASMQKMLDELKSVPCTDCGGRFPPIAMDFDHVRGRKILNVSCMARRGYSVDKILAEIKKCVVRCANCHRIRTFERGQHAPV